MAKKNQQKQQNNDKEFTAEVKYLRITPRKVRLVTDIIKGLSANEAEAELLMLPKRAAPHILKLLKSVIQNAKNNQETESSKLYVKNIFVNQGPSRFRKWIFRARGGAELIKKKTSHVRITLAEKSELGEPKFVIPVKEKKDKEKKKTKEKKDKKVDEKKDHGKKEKSTEPKIIEPKSIPKPQKSSVIKKFFRRKSI